MYVSDGKAEVGRVRAASRLTGLVALVLLLLAGCALGHVAGRLAGQVGVPAGGAAGGAGGPSRGSSEAAATLVASRPEALAPGALPAGKGQVLLAVRWPARYRAQVIPGAATVIQFALSRGGTSVASASVARVAGASTATAGLTVDAGSYLLSATASAVTTAVAAGTSSLSVVAGARTAATMTLAEVTHSYAVSTLAGSTFRDGPAASARFSWLSGIAMDASGTMILSDRMGYRIRTITASGEVGTLAGEGVAGAGDGPAGTARFQYPVSAAVDASGSVYVSEALKHRLRKISAAGVVTTLAGDGTAGYVDGPGASARFNVPVGLAVDASGTVYVADAVNNRIRAISPSGVVRTHAGDGTAGFADGATSSAQFSRPVQIAVGQDGTLYVADRNNQKIRTISPGGTVATLAGSSRGYQDGSASAARFSEPVGVAVDATGVVYVADFGNNRIRKVAVDGTVSTLAGDGQGGSVDGPGNSARFNNPFRAAVDPAGNLYVLELYNRRRVRKITPAGMVSTFAGDADFADGQGAAAAFWGPVGITLDDDQNVYVADSLNSRIRKITPAGVVSTVAGDGTAGFADGQGTGARFNQPWGLARDATGTIFVADRNSHRIRRISTSGAVTTLAGDGTAGFADGQGTAARLNNPRRLAVDAAGTVYVADAENHRIRKISPGGDVTTLAGEGTAGFLDGQGSAARFNWPEGIEVDGAGVVFVADSANHRIRKIAPGGTVSTFAGDGTQGFADGASSSARFDWPSGIRLDASGYLYVADNGNHRIRRISPAGIVSTVAGNGEAGLRDGSGSQARFHRLNDIAVGPDLALWVAEYHNNVIRLLR
ncbi:MAG: hypothetical protein FJZ01_15600 [Candidatus Sericytochromatia bacterium]|nr:hypothetical protein [Candidatus Tanganyikabacteria bacterium]